MSARVHFANRFRTVRKRDTGKNSFFLSFYLVGQCVVMDRKLKRLEVKVNADPQCLDGRFLEAPHPVEPPELIPCA